LEGESLELMRFGSTRHAKYCGYHFVWIPSTVGMFLWGEVAEYTRKVLNKILRELECEPLVLEIMPYYVHLFALCSPRHSLTYVVLNTSQGRTGQIGDTLRSRQEEVVHISFKVSEKAVRGEWTNVPRQSKSGLVAGIDTGVNNLK